MGSIKRQVFGAGYVSKYRTELMGIAALWVLAVHALDFGIRLPGKLAVIEKLMSYGQVGVDMFFFLSGIGIFYSLGKETKLTLFYGKRLKRVYFPYLAIAFPCLVIIGLLGKFDVWAVVGELSTVSYWVAGRGAWYVAVILFLYALSPLYYRIYSLSGHKGLCTLVTVIVCTGASMVLKSLSFGVFVQLGSALERAPVFVAGFWFAEMIRQDKSINPIWIVLMLISVPARSFLNLPADHIIVTLTIELWGIAVCFIFGTLLEVKWIYRIVGKILFFLGTCSLEIYLLNIYIALIAQELMTIFSIENVVLMYTADVLLSVGIGLICSRIEKRI